MLTREIFCLLLFSNKFKLQIQILFGIFFITYNVAQSLLYDIVNTQKPLHRTPERSKIDAVVLLLRSEMYINCIKLRIIMTP